MIIWNGKMDYSNYFSPLILMYISVLHSSVKNNKLYVVLNYM